MAKDIKCTCGHSWNKSDSSKKDMYICHMCGKNNTMKDGGWLDKFDQGGLVLKQKTDNYGKKPNPNDVQVSVGPDFVGLGYNTKGRNYSPAWGGQFQNGGNLWNTDRTAWVDSIHNARKDDLNFVKRYFDQSAGSIQIPGQRGTSTHFMESGDGKAYPTVVQMPNGKLQYLNQNDKDAAWKYANKTGQFIKFPTDEQAEWYANNGYKKGTGVLKKKQMGGSLPGAVGFTYARVAGSAPSNGKYAKKTKASAQNGKEMKFYQEGLDFKPNSIAQDGKAIVDPMGQWAHPGEVTIIPATDITMEGVDYPVLGISDTGDQQMMYPGEDYQFDGEYVTEYPMMKEGGWLSKYQDGGGGLSRSNLEMMAALEKDIKNQKARNAQETVSQYTPKPGDRERMNAAKDAYRKEQAKLLNRAASSEVAAKAMENIVEPMLVMDMAIGAGKLAKPALEAAGKYLTEKTALKNAYKINPFAFKPTEGMMYRGLGKEGMEDAFESGVFRAKQDVEPFMVGRFDMSKRFNKAYFSPKFDVADQYGQGYIAEVPRAASNWGKRYGRKDWSQIAQRDIPITEGKILQKDWLKRYKEVPKKENGGWLTKYK